MSLIPEEHLTFRLTFNFAPMVDFLFIVIAIFAAVAISRKAIYSTNINLIRHESSSSVMNKESSCHTLHLGISPSGTYELFDRDRKEIFTDIEGVKTALLDQIQRGVLSQNRSQNHLLLHIDQEAKWSPIAQLISVMHEEGFTLYPVYEKPGKKPLVIKN
jgi:biopolymer transport protein ExbD